MSAKRVGGADISGCNSSRSVGDSLGIFANSHLVFMLISYRLWPGGRRLVAQVACHSDLLRKARGLGDFCKTRIDAGYSGRYSLVAEYWSFAAEGPRMGPCSGS